MESKRFKTKFGGKELIIETGKFAANANASCTVQMGDTVILATVVMSKETRPGMNWFPLMVDYEEKLYAAGRIKGSRYVKREGRPTDEAVLIGRFIDRAIRPLFDNRIKNDVQVIVTVLSFDEENDPDILGLIGASTVLHMSDIPWNGPIGAVRVSKLNGEWLINPGYEQRKETEFDLDIAGTTEKVVMIEARASEAEESDLLEAFERGSKELKPVIKLIEQIRKEIGLEKLDLFSPKTEKEKIAQERKAEVEKISLAFIGPVIRELFFDQSRPTRAERNAGKEEVKERLVAHLTEQGVDENEHWIGTGLIYDAVQDEISKMILEEGRRVDGRQITEVRPLIIEAGLLPRVHGSGHFSRGETQVLSVCTLGAPGDKQTLDGMETVGEQRYMHHYNFPPFSVGEAKPLRGAGRREVGHGALAEKAVVDMLPPAEEFPYAIRVVSEVMNSNGSSSMASTCGSTLALMDAGVPIKSPVAGIAIGIASRGDDWKVITDIQDLEDGAGGMDFKVTGTKKGFTAIQMDTKTQGITQEMIAEALTQGRNAINGILDQMIAVIAEPRAELSPYAPRILTINIDPEKIRTVIGPGGKMINEIIEKTGVETIDIEQTGLVMITSKNGESGQAALEWVRNLTREVETGEIFDGQVVKIMDFGAFVNILPGKDGMVHVSELAPWRVNRVDDIVKIGDTVKVKVMEIDDMGRVNLSMKQAEGNVYTEEMKKKSQEPSAPRPQSGGSRGPRRDSRPQKRR
ncbi:MAG: polyribonucleotide nucleotidyltransferase [Candidatus Uhrbacteria bacterium]|nr:polyribonucleotide nucleotidyltransferase [Candidatus Uhrbacteria bacterium]